MVVNAEKHEARSTVRVWCGRCGQVEGAIIDWVARDKLTKKIPASVRVTAENSWHTHVVN